MVATNTDVGVGTSGDDGLRALDEMAAAGKPTATAAADGSGTTSGHDGSSRSKEGANGAPSSGSASAAAAASAGRATGSRNRSSSAAKKGQRRRKRNTNAGAAAGAAQSGGSSGRGGQRSARDDIKSAAKPSVSTSPDDNTPSSTVGRATGAADRTTEIAAPAPPGPPSSNASSRPSGNGHVAGPAGNGRAAGSSESSPGRPVADAASGTSGAASVAAAAAVTGELLDLVKPQTDGANPPPPSAADAIAIPATETFSAAPSNAAGGAHTEQLDAVPTAPPAMPGLGPTADAARPANRAAASAAPAAAAKAAAAVAAAEVGVQAALAEAAPTITPATETPPASGDASPATSAPTQRLELKGDVPPEPASQPSRALTAPGSGFDLAVLPNVFRRKRRVQARKVRRVIRHIDPWSVLTFSVLFHLCVFAALLLASVLVWNAAEAAGTIENMEAFILELGDYETFDIKGDVVFRAAVAIAGILTLASSVLLVLLTVVFNLISDLVGGIRLTVIEEETVRVRRKKQTP